MGPDAVRFAGARVLRLAASHLDVALGGTEADLAAWLLGVVRQFVPTYRRDDVTPDAAAAATARMARLIPRKLRADLLPFALESSGAIDAGALALGIREGANRVGLLAQGHLDVALRVVLALAGGPPPCGRGAARARRGTRAGRVRPVRRARRAGPRAGVIPVEQERARPGRDGPARRAP
jgi:hypothetical protein